MLDLLGQTTGGGLLLPFRLLGILVLGLACCVGGLTVDERNDNLLDVDFGVQLRGCGEEGAESVEVELVREDLDHTGVGTRPYLTHLNTTAYLDHDLHKILLRNDVLANNNLLQDTRKDNLLIHVEVYALQLAQADEVRADEDT